LRISPKDPIAIEVRREARHLIEIAQRPHDKIFLERLLEGVFDRASLHTLEALMAPLFARALSASRSTAWAISDDKTASVAAAFLSKHGKKIPDDISLISFDNWPLAFSEGLSSYDFNFPGLVQQAILMIIDEKSLKSRPVISEVDGYVVERRTTRLR
jgi:DNA-binding LacI/PurR family transcriptional regulator